MRESIITTTKRFIENSEVEEGAVWLYRFTVLAMLAAISLNQVGAPSQEVIKVTTMVIHAGVILLLFSTVGVPILHEVKHRWEAHG